MTKAELITQVKKIASSYSQATGVDCMVLEKQTATPIQVTGTMPKGCQSCASARNSHLPLSCQRDHTDYFFPGANHRNYIHMCRSGFIFWGSSIIWQGQTLATILAYSSLLKEESETLQNYKEELSKRVRQDTNFTEVLDYAPKRIQGMAQILFLCCQAISHNPAAAQSPVSSLSGHQNQPLPIIQRTTTPQSLYNIQYQGEDVYDIIENIFTNGPKDLEATKLKIRELSHWLAKIAGISGTLDETALSANLSLLKQIENQDSAEQLYEWINEIANSFYKTAFKLHDLQHGDALARAIRYMHQKYDTDISMESVSEIADLSYSYFSRVFKKEVGVNFNDYLNQIRIEKSKKLLAKGEMSLLDIAQKCGFKDQSYYSKSFKKITGVSPGKYRSRMKCHKN